MSDRFELSPEHKIILAAATSRLLPSEDGPGAAETRVVDYIELALQDRWHADFVPLLRRGLDFLQHLAGQGRSFAACSPEEQDEILCQVQKFPNNEARKFFETLIDLTLEGFLCDPRHGGNRAGLGWKYIGRTFSNSPCLGKDSA
jgi:gluconate 2-dehydrogenase gamma chain